MTSMLLGLSNVLLLDLLFWTAELELDFMHRIKWSFLGKCVFYTRIPSSVKCSKCMLITWLDGEYDIFWLYLVLRASFILGVFDE